MARSPHRSRGSAHQTIMFGPFCLDISRHVLLKGNEPVQVGSRALEILIALIDHPGELVEKDELVARAWPNVTVDESNLRAQVALLRKTLGEGQAGARYIAVVPGRGYRFVAPLTYSGVAGEAEAPDVCGPSSPSRSRPIRSKLSCAPSCRGEHDPKGQVLRTCGLSDIRDHGIVAAHVPGRNGNCRWAAQCRRLR